LLAAMIKNQTGAVKLSGAIGLAALVRTDPTVLAAILKSHDGVLQSWGAGVLIKLAEQGKCT
jgi:hypothetical protein